MTQNLTLHSRLKILIAKTFRAEKLYGSIRNSQSGQIAHLQLLSDIANDMRAREWQRSHFQLRTTLNDLLADATSASLTTAVVELQQSFKARAEESNAALAQGINALQEATRRQEFAHVLKLSVELIRQRARAQANQVITDELTAVLESTGRSVPEGITALVGGVANADVSDDVADDLVSGDAAANDQKNEDADDERFSNVISLDRRRASGNRFPRR